MPFRINSLIKDENGISVQIGNSFKTIDASGTPKSSPLTLSGGVQAIRVPEGAVEFIVYPLAHSLAVSEDPIEASYDVVAAGSKESFPCARMESIYVQGTSADLMYFRFTIV